MRALVVTMLALAFTGCIWTSGPDCAASCQKIVSCPGVSGTYLLSCNGINGDCYDQVADCAQCIDDKSCGDLDAGQCDSVCRLDVDGGP